MSPGAVASPVAPTAAQTASRGGVDGPSGARIGPNAVLQTLRALEGLEGEPAARAVRAAADLPEVWPEGLIPEAWFVATLRAVRERLPEARAEAVLARSGAGTAAYVAQHRIPAPFRGLLGILPQRWAVALLLRAFGRHAWTFAGSGRFAVRGSDAITLETSPTSRPEARAPTGPACGYYAAAFEGLLGLASPRVRVREVACRAAGAPECRFAVTLADDFESTDHLETSHRASPGS